MEEAGSPPFGRVGPLRILSLDVEFFHGHSSLSDCFENRNIHPLVASGLLKRRIDQEPAVGSMLIAGILTFCFNFARPRVNDDVVLSGHRDAEDKTLRAYLVERHPQRR